MAQPPTASVEKHAGNLCALNNDNDNCTKTRYHKLEKCSLSQIGKIKINDFRCKRIELNALWRINLNYLNRFNGNKKNKQKILSWHCNFFLLQVEFHILGRSLKQIIILWLLLCPMLVLVNWWCFGLTLSIRFANFYK